jgi:hypothetical protein
MAMCPFFNHQSFLDLTYIGFTLLILHFDVRITQIFLFLVSTWKKKTYKIYNAQYQVNAILLLYVIVGLCLLDI